MNIDARSHYLTDFARVVDLLPGAGVPWLARVRKSALDQFAQRGFPTRKDEDWKYTSVAALEKMNFRVEPDGRAHTGANPLMDRFALASDIGHVLVFHNGRFAPWLSAIGKLPDGARLVSLADALEAAPEALEPYLASEEPQSAFGALNGAFMADGAYLHLKRGTVLEAPVHLLFLSTEPGFANHVRNVIVAEEGAQATVIEHYAGIDGATYFNNVVTRIFAAGNAAIEHHKLQQEGSGAFHVAGIHAVQQRDSRLESHSISFGAALARNDITTAFDGNGCEVTLNGLYLVGGTQHVDHHTRIDHRQPNGTSREHYRGVLEGQSHAVFNGKVIVQPGAQKTNAYQANHNLLLSRDAEVDTKPELEIYADDVKCNHGATVGQLDEAQLFYLRSRGIDEAVARSLLVHAFAHDVIERIRVASLRTRLEQILLARLPQEERIGEL
ncbi:MAG TPA: Fe-S cluster assembly protein SufD [Noviherbaspirillum sp.]|uniref:Fe-S cluster assembly protein SufD n=1 Tax=Noviherbaspirillum sp. TaxID=1926288 RepID=UPI002B4A9768|nr:Fe-S cluster assembly protein SufD [Noviherbaspirillum sp.]HJV84260.1 Fe-S cluster assembly protein SufD [Noviherbaspirillum sp.]